MDRQEALIAQLRIDRKSAAPKRRRWPWFVLMPVVAIGAWVAISGGRPVPVETAEARAVASDENTSVLDASGYVTARRQATVSSKVTGKVREV
ncbi:MAG: efflux RND transporter periplasmic adaptor subunit, partial [Xanthomonadales bacterium]|nr:efflux RND transporter periplasmic adaptor subunit [Xanthomonadales bacterium]